MININDSLKELIDMLKDNKDKWLIMALILMMTNKNNEIDEETINKIKQLIEDRKENK